MKTRIIIFSLLLSVIFSANTSCGNSHKRSITSNPKDSINQMDTIFNNFSRTFYDVSLFLAGMEADKNTSLKGLDSNKVFLEHKKIFNEFYKNTGEKRIAPIYEFSKQQLSGVNDSIQTLFYPFSGPDFLHANIFFPKAKEILMAGLERVGSVPNLSGKADKELSTFFKATKIALDSIFIFGYFMTNDMNKDFARSLELRGVTPIIMLFMARAGFIILNVEKGTINSAGTFVGHTAGAKYADDPYDAVISTVKFTYIKKGEKELRTLYYTSHDMSDASMQKTPGLLKFYKSRPVNVTYLKAASYLMWYFNPIRDFALQNSKFIYQSDCGIPMKYFFGNTAWKIQLYGTYRKPIGVFKYCLQPELKKAYQTWKNIIPLNFGIDYGIRLKDTNQMLLRKK